MNCQDLLNEKECLEIVQRSLSPPDQEEIKLLNYRITRGSDTLIGFMGEYYTLTVVIEKGKVPRNLNYFVKSLPITDPFYRKELQEKKVFIKESRIYKEVLSNLAKYAPVQLFPKCYLTRDDIIVLEDLSSSYSHMHKTFSLADQKLVLKHLAQLHAASIAWESEAGINIGEKFGGLFNELQFTEENSWFVAGLEGLIFLALQHEKYQHPQAQDFIRNKLFDYICDFKFLMDPSEEFQNVFCHRDCWNRNILFQFNDAQQPTKCQLVDFQLSRYGLPAMDVLWFLYSTMYKERRSEVLDECLDFYYSAFKEAMEYLQIPERMFSKESFRKSVEVSHLPILVVWAICEPLMRLPEGAANQMRLEDPEKFDFYMNKERSGMLKRVMDMDPMYRTQIMKSVEELLDTIFEKVNTSQ